MKYDTYLFTCLLRENKTFFSSLGYDVQYRVALNLYNDYLNSDYCNPLKENAQCMREYIAQGLLGNSEDEDIFPIMEICKN